MKLTIVGPNIPQNTHETLHVHKAGCADLKRGVYRAVSPYEKHDEEHDSVESLVEEWYGPNGGSFYEEAFGEDIPADAWTHYESEFWIAPCVKDLPREAAVTETTV